MSKEKLLNDKFEFQYDRIITQEQKTFSINREQFKNEVKELLGDKYGDDIGDDITDEMWRDIYCGLEDDWDIEYSSRYDFEEEIIERLCEIYEFREMKRRRIL